VRLLGVRLAAFDEPAARGAASQLELPLPLPAA
jgi:hypothetical protein